MGPDPAAHHSRGARTERRGRRRYLGCDRLLLPGCSRSDRGWEEPLAKVGGLRDQRRRAAAARLQAAGQSQQSRTASAWSSRTARARVRPPPPCLERTQPARLAHAVNPFAALRGRACALHGPPLGGQTAQRSAVSPHRDGGSVPIDDGVRFGHDRTGRMPGTVPEREAMPHVTFPNTGARDLDRAGDYSTRWAAAVAAVSR